MNYNQIINNITEKLDIPVLNKLSLKRKSFIVKQILDKMPLEIIDALSIGDSIMIPNLGIFETYQLKAHMAFDPNIKSYVQVPERTRIRFKLSTSVKYKLKYWDKKSTPLKHKIIKDNDIPERD